MKRKLIAIALTGVLAGCGGGGGGSDDDIATPTPPPASNTPPSVTAATTDTLNGEEVTIDLSEYAEDADGDELVIESIGTPENGEITFNGLTVTYDPKDDFAGTETITVAITDGTDTVEQTVTFSSYQGVTLSGQVVDEPIPGAIVTVKIGDEEFTATADEMGRYNLDIKSIVSNSYIKVVATGGEGAETSGIELVSLLGELNSVIDSAGDDGVFGGDDVTAANVTNVTTAQYVLAKEANNGEEIVSSKQMTAAEKAITADKLIEVAAVIKLVLDNPNYTLPEGFNSVVDFVSNTSSYNSFVEEVVSENPEDNALTAAIAQVLTDPALMSAFTVSEVGSTYYSTSAAAPGLLARGGELFQFNQDGTGSVANERGATKMTWVVDKGELVLAYNEPQEQAFFYSIYDLVDEDAADVWIARTGSSQIQVTQITSGARVTLVSQGENLNTVAVNSTYDIRYHTNGIIALEDENDVPSQYRTLWRDGSVEIMPIVEEDLSDTWAAYSLYENAYGFTYAGDLFEFAANGTGNALLSERTFSWVLESNVLSINFEDETTLEVKKIDAIGELSGLALRTTNSDGKLLSFTYEFGTWQDEGALTPQNVITEDGSHWATFVNGWITDFWENGEFNYVEGSGFGWSFLPNGVVENYSFGMDTYDEDNDSNTQEIVGGVYRTGDWWFDNETDILTFTYGQCPEVCDFRNWLGLQSSESEIIVMERAGYGDGTSLEEAHYFIPARLNIYRRWDLPQVDMSAPDKRIVAYPSTSKIAPVR